MRPDGSRCSSSWLPTRVAVVAMEPRAGVGDYDKARDFYTLHVPTQGVAGNRVLLATLLKVRADQIRILDEGRLVATHPILEGRRQYRVDAAHRRGATARPVRHPADHQVIVGQIGDRVAHRSLAFYQAVGERLAVAGGRP